MKQYQLINKTLILEVKQSNIIIRGTLFFLAFTSFLLPLMGLMFSILDGKGFHVGFVIGIFLFGLIGVYLLRIFLWNTYGKEIIHFHDSKIEYITDYRWFKDVNINIESNNIVLLIKKTEQDINQKGTLIIERGNEKIESVITMPIHQIEEIIEKLQPLIN